MGVTLITWACGHFCTKRTPAYASEKSFLAAVAEDFWFLVDSADEDLANVATERHLACNEDCPKCQEPVSVKYWQVRAQSGIDNLNILRSGMKEIYLGLGGKYYQLDFSQKAKFAHDDSCTLAHQQFWISKVARSKDVFFTPIEQILRLCNEADLALQSSKTHADVRKAFVHINNARAEVGRIINPLDELMSGVELMGEAESRERDNLGCQDGLMSREAMVSIAKASNWFARMEDWRDAAMEATVQACLERT